MLHFDLSQRIEKRRLSHGTNYVYRKSPSPHPKKKNMRKFRSRMLQSLNSDYDKTMHVAASPTAGALRIQP
jgi:hypothetical protein